MKSATFALPATHSSKPATTSDPVFPSALFLLSRTEDVISNLAPCYQRAFQTGMTALEAQTAAYTALSGAHDALDLQNQIDSLETDLTNIPDDESLAIEGATHQLHADYYEQFKTAVAQEEADAAEAKVIQKHIRRQLKLASLIPNARDARTGAQTHDTAGVSGQQTAPPPPATLPTTLEPIIRTRAQARRAGEHSEEPPERAELRGAELRGAEGAGAQFSPVTATPPGTPSSVEFDLLSHTLRMSLSQLSAGKKKKTSATVGVTPLQQFAHHPLHEEYKMAVTRTSLLLKQEFREKTRAIQSQIRELKAQKTKAEENDLHGRVETVTHVYMHIETHLRAHLADFIAKQAVHGPSLVTTMNARIQMAAGDIFQPYMSGNIGACVENLRKQYKDQDFSGFVKIFVKMLQNLTRPNPDPVVVMEEINLIASHVDQLDLHRFFTRDAILSVVALSALSHHEDKQLYNEAHKHVTRFAQEHDIDNADDDHTMPLVNALDAFLRTERRESATRADIQQTSVQMSSQANTAAKVTQSAPRANNQFQYNNNRRNNNYFPRSETAAAVTTVPETAAAAMSAPTGGQHAQGSSRPMHQYIPLPTTVTGVIKRAQNFGIMVFHSRNKRDEMVPYTATQTDTCECPKKPSCGCFHKRCGKCHYFGHKEQYCRNTDKNPAYTPGN